MIYIASDRENKAAKERLIHLLQKEIEETGGLKDGDGIEDLGSGDAFDLSCEMARAIEKDPQVHRGIFVDSYGALPFMSASKFPKIICAECNDEHSSKMTRDHNNANMITFGTSLIGEEVALSICRRFLKGRYSAGRHQIRIDMLDAMCHEPVQTSVEESA